MKHFAIVVAFSSPASRDLYWPIIMDSGLVTELRTRNSGGWYPATLERTLFLLGCHFLSLVYAVSRKGTKFVLISTASIECLESGRIRARAQ